MIEAVSAMAEMLADLHSVASAGAPRIDMPGAGVNSAGDAPAASFSASLKAAVGRVDGTIAAANGLAASFASGNHDIPLSDVMVSLEQANLSLQLAANVRDKVVGAYTSIMNMQL